MPSSAETVCASSARPESRFEPRLELPPTWIADPLEISVALEMPFRAIAWSALLSAVLWTSFYFAIRALWSLWR
jgi:hypothetical protein